MSGNSTAQPWPGPPPTLRGALAAFIPGLSIPPASNIELASIYGLVVLIQFTTTYSHRLLPYARLALALPTCLLAWEYGLTGKHEPKPNKYAQLGMSLMGCYAIMKVIEICVVGFFLNHKPSDWPQWVSKKEKDPKSGKPKVIHFTPTILGRLIYSVDLLSVRGSSWISGRVWDFAPVPIAKFDSPPRVQYVISVLYSMLQQYIAFDIIETIMFSRHWDSRNPRSVTSLPSIPQQMIFALCCCIGTALSISAPYAMNTLNTMLFGAPPSAWPPMFDSPLSSQSLAEFWSYKWHAIFRRVFDRLSLGVLMLIPTSLNPRFAKFLRALVIFGLSMTLHLFLMWSLPEDELHPYPSLWNTQALKFFLSQPLGLLVEFLAVRPVTKMLPPTLGREIGRAFAWGWLLWSGRFWSDVWIQRGLWGYQERFIVFSPLRKVLYGTWIV